MYAPEKAALTWSLDGHSIGTKHLELREALQDPTKFKEFSRDPRSFASRYGVQLDAEVAGALRDGLATAGSYGEAQVGRPTLHPAAANPVYGVSLRPAAANAVTSNPPVRRH